MKEPLLTVDEAAQLKGVTSAAIYAAVKEARLPHTLILRRIGLREDDLRQWTPRSYGGRPGAKSGRPPGTPMSEEAKERISKSQTSRWKMRKRHG